MLNPAEPTRDLLSTIDNAKVERLTSLDAHHHVALQFLQVLGHDPCRTIRVLLADAIHDYGVFVMFAASIAWLLV